MKAHPVCPKCGSDKVWTENAPTHYCGACGEEWETKTAEFSRVRITTRVAPRSKDGDL